MERLMPAGLAARVAQLGAHAAWELRRAARAVTRRFGLFGWAILACALCAAVAVAVERRQAAQAATLEARLAARLAQSASSAVDIAIVPVQDDGGARGRLKTFDDLLLPHAEIPGTVQALLDLGAAEGLSIQRGTYRPQVDVAGGFLRYRMTFPVKGSGQAIERYMKAALREHQNLALDSVQFKRARVGASEIEARIHWVMLARLPSGTAR